MDQIEQAPEGWYGYRNRECGAMIASDVVCDLPASHVRNDAPGCPTDPRPLVRHKAHNPSGTGGYIVFDGLGRIIRDDTGRVPDLAGGQSFARAAGAEVGREIAARSDRVARFDGHGHRFDGRFHHNCPRCASHGIEAPEDPPPLSIAGVDLSEYAPDGHEADCESYALSSQTDEVPFCSCAARLYNLVTEGP